MIEPRHQRRIPSGRRLARVLADVFRAMLPHARAAVRAGRVPSLAGYEAVLIRALLPILLHEWQLGREQIRRELKSVRRLRRKAAFPFGGNAPEGLISVVFGPDALPDAVPRAVQQAILALAGSVTDSTRQAIRDRLEIGLREGESNGEIADRLTDLFSPQRAYTIAASEASRAQHAGEAAQAQEYGAAGMEWIASQDACSVCLPLDGKRVRFGEPFVTLTHGNPAYRTVLHPPAHPRCLLGETPVFVPSLVSATHVKYQGPVVRVRCADGSDVTVTPNHMLLTASGFARACDLVEGDDIIRTRLAPEHLAVPSAADPDVNRKPTTAEQEFRAFAESGRVSSCRVPVAPEYLHGDAAFGQGEIDVVWADGELRGDRETRASQPVEHVPLIGRLGFDAAGLRFSGESDLAAVFHSLLAATNGVMGRRRELAALSWGESRVAEKLRLGAGSDRQAQLAEPADDGWAACVQRMRDVQDAFPGIVETTKVIQIEFKTLSHGVSVYDFGTAETLYIVGSGLVSSNCMCSSTPWWDE